MGSGMRSALGATVFGVVSAGVVALTPVTLDSPERFRCGVPIVVMIGQGAGRGERPPLEVARACTSISEQRLVVASMIFALVETTAGGLVVMERGFWHR